MAFLRLALWWSLVVAVAAFAAPGLVRGGNPPEYDTCGLRPWDPVTNAPRLPAPPGAPCSTRGFFRVDCGTPPTTCTLGSNHVPPILHLRHAEVVNGMCVVVEDSQFAVCDDIVELNALPSVCPRRPAPPRQALSVDSTGHTLLSGESIELSIVVSDNCGNVFECRAEPILDPDPADPTRTLLCPPKAARCPVSSRCPL